MIYSACDYHCHTLCLFLEHFWQYYDLNRKFDVALKARDPSWGVRNVEDVIELAVMNGLYLDRTVEMPANNLSLIFCKGRT